jgi:putative ABC transport system permease protein
MRLFIRLFRESIIFSIHALIVNKLRTFLSLLGITIGIFAIISVFTMVDSMERNLQDSVASLGKNVVFVQKWPWSFGSDYPWWKYINRPEASIAELLEIQKRSELAEASTFVFDVNKTVEYGNNSLENVNVICASHDYNRVRDFELQAGRYFSENESTGGRNVIIIGNDVSLALFGFSSPIGKSVKCAGRRFTVVGLFKKEGESIIGNTMDNAVLLPLNFVRKIIDLRSERIDPSIMVKARNGISNQALKDELTGIMRSVRKLKPIAEDNFALNESSVISYGIEALFKTVNWAGAIIGLFSILVGGFGIANIMFVSVKERTPLIGIQKSLGAKNSFILFQFLAEAIILCLIGGGIGLLVIFGGTLLVQNLLEINVFLSAKNVILGLSISAGIGLVSGIIPAYFASRLDPVEAIRSN